MGLHKLTAGDGYSYLTRQVAAHDSTEKGARGLGDYYSERGESPGRWMGHGLAGLGIAADAPVTEAQMKSLFGEGRHPDAKQLAQSVAAVGGGDQAAHAAGALGRRFPVYEACAPFQEAVARAFTAFNTDRGRAWNAPIAVDERAAIRDAVAARMFAAAHGRPPADPRELAGFVARASRQATTAIAGFDLTFSPVKSVSVLWALAPAAVAAQVRDAHDAAVADIIAWLETEAGFTRVGRAGARQVPVRGLVCAAFTHRDSRAGDPDLHAHVAVSNKVQTGDGRWLALDARVLFHAKVAASERYNTRLEGELGARLGVRFIDRETRPDRRPVREIAGVNPLLARWWSSRRRDIEARRTSLATQFQTHHGRPPTAIEAIALAQQATLETRQAKHEPCSEADQQAAWRAEADRVLGGPAEVDDMLTDTLATRAEAPRLPAGWVAQAAAITVAVLEQDRATWRVWHVRAEAERQARAGGVPLADHDVVVDQTVAYALGELSIRLGSADPIREPAGLCRPNGDSVYDVHGTARYTSARVIAAEQRLLDVAAATGARTISDVRVGIALAEQAANGVVLSDAQATMVGELATSGRRLQLGLAPAGTGKTTAMRVLSRAWSDAGGDVLGLAPSAQAAHELGHAVGGHTDTLAKLTWALTHTPRDQWPAWVDQIGPRTLVIVDEAGRAGTAELDVAVDHLVGRGATIRLIGDDQQLAAVGAGGILRDIKHTQGAATLSQVRRFTDPAEAAATLAVRDGDTSALGFYADNGRIHVGDTGSACDQAYAAWAADRRTGLDSVLLAPTRELVAQLNARARTDRLHGSAATARGTEVRLSDGTRACAGDTVVTRRNDRRLVISGSDWVKNGDRWAVEAVNPDGSIRVRHATHRRSATLPAGYVADHVQLGYAATVHAAQGITTDTAHVVVAGDESRQLLYVALSRGRSGNYIYLADAHDGDPHSLIRRDTLLPPTANEVLEGILQRDGSQHSATSTRRELDSPAVGLHQAATRYADALGVAAEHTIGEKHLAELERQLEAIWPGLTGEAAYPTLRARLALDALDGHDPLALLLDASAGRELGTAKDRAAVLDWRLPARQAVGPLPWLAAVPKVLREHPEWGSYLDARAARVTTLAQQVRSRADSWSPTEVPGWAAGLPATHHADHSASLRGDLAVWRAAFAVPDTDTRPTGARQLGSDAAEQQRQLQRRIRDATGGTATATTPRAWRDLLPEAVTGEPAAVSLYEKLDSLCRAGVPVDSLLSDALAGPRRPLPDEHAADALWWRIVRHLGPAALPSARGTDPPLRPDWTPILAELLGTEAAEHVTADPAWPALVAAVHARPGEWTADQLLTAATGGGHDRLPPEELCSALVWRVATLTDPPDDDHDQPPPDPLRLEGEPLPDMQRTAYAVQAAGEPATSRDRIIELNRAAVGVYSHAYPKSWAPAYLLDRLGTDLSDDPLFTVGYAPPGPTSLIRQLTREGATETELMDAGLARLTDRGRLVDALRDRVVFPIHHGSDVVGFICRRNPTKDDDEYAGPKYLNTRATAAFTKGEQLFGLTEAGDRLAAGATPVLVEGPLDAIAVTHATRGRYAGIAPLGTAFTPEQALHLRPLFRDQPSNIIIATDADPAGWASAQRAFWRLAQHGADPQHLVMRRGLDPADVLHSHSASGLSDALNQTRPLAESLVDAIIDVNSSDPQSPATRLRLVRQTAQIIGTLPPEQWLTHIDRVTALAILPAGMLHIEVLDAGTHWTNNPARAAAQRLAEAAPRRANPRRRTTADCLQAPACQPAQRTKPGGAQPRDAHTLDRHPELREPGGRPWQTVSPSTPPR